MKLEQLRPNLLDLLQDKAFALFQKYYESRALDIKAETLEPVKTKRTKKATKKKDEVTLTSEQIIALKALGVL